MIKGSLASAEKAREEMLKLQSDNEAILRKAREEREVILKEGRDVRDRLIAEAKGNEDAKKEKVNALRELNGIEEIRARATAKIWLNDHKSTE